MPTAHVGKKRQPLSKPNAAPPHPQLDVSMAEDTLIFGGLYAFHPMDMARTPPSVFPPFTIMMGTARITLLQPEMI